MSTHAKTPFVANKPRRRDFGKSGPLNRLSKEVREELVRRCEGHDTFAQIEKWLKEEHGVKTSSAGLSGWWKHHGKPVSEQKPATASIEFGPFEIFVTAPGAQTISIRVVPIKST